MGRLFTLATGTLTRPRQWVTVGGFLGMSLLFATFAHAQAAQPDTAAAQAGPAAQGGGPAAQAPARPLFSAPKWTVDFGANAVDLDGARPGKFEETRDVPRGFFARSLQVDLTSSASPLFAFVHASDVRELDQAVHVTVGRTGRFLSSFVWDQLPRSYSDGRTLFTSATPGVLTVSPAIRASFQAVVDGQNPAAIPPALFGLVQSEISRAQTIDLRTRRDLASFEQRIQPSADWTIQIGASQQRNRGIRPRGVGTFGRTGTGGGVGDGVWESLGVELPEPVDYRTTGFTLGAGIAKRKWRAGGDYALSLFRDQVSALTYENPFRVTDAPGNPPGSAVGRFRMVNGQVALPPNTDFHTVALHASADVSAGTQARGAFSWSQSTQNDQFLPYTLNTALRIARTGGSAALPADLPITSTSALPAQSLNGKIRTMTHDYAIVSNVGKSNRLSVQFTADDMDNLSPVIVFPGFAKFGESAWLTSLDYYGVPIQNRPSSFLRQDVTAAWRWDASQKFTANAEYQLEVWDRELRDADRTTEHSGRGWIDVRPTKAVTIKADYRYADRQPRLYTTQPLVFTQNFAYTINNVPAIDPLGAWVVTPQTQLDPNAPLEFNLLRRFDESARRRHDAMASIDVRGGTKATFSASYHTMRDDYADGFYGLNFTHFSTAAVEFTATPLDGTMFFANYSHDQNRLGYLGLGHLITGSIVEVTACCAQYPIANTWDRRGNATLDTFQVGLSTATKNERILFDVAYVLSSAQDRVSTTNPYAILPISPLTAGAYDYPDVISRWQEIDATVRRQLRPGLQVGVRYRYEPYKLDDFFLNDLQPYPQGLVTSGGVAVNLQRQLLLNARFTDYQAQVATVFLRASF